MMKWMGWGWSELQDCPADLIPVIADAMEREAEANRRKKS
jgi:hypothetical protein